MNTYLSYDIFEPSVKAAEGNTIKNNYELIGKINTNREVFIHEHTIRGYTITLYQDTDIERKELKDFFISKKGKLIPFWYKSPIYSGVLIKDVEIDGTELKFKDTSIIYQNKYSTIFLYDPITNFQTKVLSVNKQFNDEFGKYETLSIRETPGVLIPSGTKFYLLTFCRFDNDGLTLDAESFNTSTATITLKGLDADVTKLQL